MNKAPKNFSESGAASMGVIVIVVALVVVGVVYFVIQNKGQKTPGPTPTATLQPNEAPLGKTLPVEKNTVTAKDGKFSPNSFQMIHFQPFTIIVTAVDKDYVFRIQDAGLDYTLKKGTKTEISLADLGAGLHTFYCGAGCSGTVSVRTEADEESR